MAEQPRTVFAQKALDFAQLFALAFGQAPLACRNISYKIEMSAPEGVSTGGGKQGVQHITLIPSQGANIVIGSANRATMSAVIRTHALLRQNHERRAAGSPFELEMKPYNELIERLTEFFKNQGMELKTEDATAQAAAAPAGKAGAKGAAPAKGMGKLGKMPKMLYVAIGAGVLLIGVVAFFMMRGE